MKTKSDKGVRLSVTIPDFAPISAYLRACGWSKEADEFEAKYAPALLAHGIGMPRRFGCNLGYDLDNGLCALSMKYANGVILDLSFPHPGFVTGCTVVRRVRGKYGSGGETERCSQLDPDLAARLLAIFIADAAVKDSDRKDRPE